MEELSECPVHLGTGFRVVAAQAFDEQIVISVTGAIDRRRGARDLSHGEHRQHCHFRKSIVRAHGSRSSAGPIDRSSIGDARP